jgi:hypothetical protein
MSQGRHARAMLGYTIIWDPTTFEKVVTFLVV